MSLDLLVPRFPLRHLPAMLAIAALGALVAGLYGIVHDQLTYTLSAEYFTKLKFRQFAWADLGLPRRVFVAEIGLLASWWVGLIGGWLLARAGAAQLPPQIRWPLVARSFVLVTLVTLTAGPIGWLLGTAVAGSTSLVGWQAAKESLGLADLPSFVIVAHIHNATYLGAALGILVAIYYIRRSLRAAGAMRILELPRRTPNTSDLLFRAFVHSGFRDARCLESRNRERTKMRNECQAGHPREAESGSVTSGLFKIPKSIAVFPLPLDTGVMPPKSNDPRAKPEAHR